MSEWKTIEKEFDKKFVRKDKSLEKLGYMRKWFIHDTITGDDILSFFKERCVPREEVMCIGVENHCYCLKCQPVHYT